MSREMYANFPRTKARYEKRVKSEQRIEAAAAKVLAKERQRRAREHVQVGPLLVRDI